MVQWGSEESGEVEEGPWRRCGVSGPAAVVSDCCRSTCETLWYWSVAWVPFPDATPPRRGDSSVTKASLGASRQLGPAAAVAVPWFGRRWCVAGETEENGRRISRPC